MNPYLRNLNRLEFIVTWACTGRCKHCSEGDHTATGPHIDDDIAAQMVRDVAGQYNIDSLLTFGGEPLLYPDVICRIHATAREAGIPKRQVITNGFFTRDQDKIRRTALALAENGVNDLSLSVDAFHQETIPLEPVLVFAKAIHALGLPRFKVHPAWLVGENADNPYNNKTRELLAQFNALGIPTSSGNVIHPGGNALKHLREYFDLTQTHVSKYTQDPNNLTSLCALPNGDVCGGNLYQNGILDILENYRPGGN